MPRFSRSQFRNAVRAKRETLWLGGTFQSTTITAVSNPVLLSSLNAAALALTPFTVVRSRGMLSVRSDQIAATEDVIGAYGMAVVSTQASGIGVSAIPTPVTDDNSDLFLVFQAFMHSFHTDNAGANHEPAGDIVMLESKAMRKVEEGNDLVTVVETATAAGATILTYLRVLIKLH